MLIDNNIMPNMLKIPLPPLEKGENIGVSLHYIDRSIIECIIDNERAYSPTSKWIIFSFHLF